MSEGSDPKTCNSVKTVSSAPHHVWATYRVAVSVANICIIVLWKTFWLTESDTSRFMVLVWVIIYYQTDHELPQLNITTQKVSSMGAAGQKTPKYVSRMQTNRGMFCAPQACVW